MKLNKKIDKQAFDLDECESAGQKLNRKQRRFAESHLKKWHRANLQDIMDGIGPHEDCNEFA